MFKSLVWINFSIVWVVGLSIFYHNAQIREVLDSQSNAIVALNGVQCNRAKNWSNQIEHNRLVDENIMLLFLLAEKSSEPAPDDRDPSPDTESEIVLMVKDGMAACIPKEYSDEWHRKMGPGWQSASVKLPPVESSESRK